MTHIGFPTNTASFFVNLMHRFSFPPEKLVPWRLQCLLPAVLNFLPFHILIIFHIFTTNIIKVCKKLILFFGIYTSWLTNVELQESLTLSLSISRCLIKHKWNEAYDLIEHIFYLLCVGILSSAIVRPERQRQRKIEETARTAGLKCILILQVDLHNCFDSVAFFMAESTVLR